MDQVQLIAFAVLFVVGVITVVAFIIGELRHARRRDIDYAFASGYREGYSEGAKGWPPRDFPWSKTTW